MARETKILAAFSRGEISPRLYGRVDLAAYQTALARCRNMVLLPHGGVARRPGTQMVARTIAAGVSSRLIPFEFSTTQAYMLEFGDLAMRVLMNGGQVLYGGSPYQVASPWTAAQLDEIDYAQSADLLYLVHPDAMPQQLTRTDHTAWAFTAYDPIDGPYEDENTDTSKRITPSGTGQYLKNGGFDNSISDWTDKSTGGTAPNNAKLVWDSGGWMTLYGVSGTSSAYAEQAFTMPVTGYEYTLEFEVLSGPITMRLGTATTLQDVKADVAYPKGVHTVKFTPATATLYLGFLHTANASRAIDNVRIFREESITLASDFDIFQAGHVGAFWRLTHGAETGYVKITGFTDARHVTAVVKEPLASTGATHLWREGSWSGVRGYPSSVVFHQGRLCFAGSRSAPQTIWCSRVGRFNDHTPGVDADDPINLTLGSNSVNSINWLVSGKSLVAGTVGAEWRIGAADSDTPISPAGISPKEETTYGSASGVKPLKVGLATIFVQRNKRKVRELVYDYSTNGWQAPNVSILSEHITVGGISEVAYAQDPDSIIWMVRNDGVLVGFTYERTEQVMGWHWHDTDGEFERVATLPAGETDQVWVVVKREVDGQVVRFIELFAVPFVDQDQGEAFYVDCGLTYRGTDVSSLTGLDHLEGKTVQILADGAVSPQKVVTGGAVSLQKPSSVVHVGLGFTSQVQTLRVEAGGNGQTSQGAMKRIPKFVLRLYRSSAFQVGPSLDRLYQPPFRTDAVPLGSPQDFYSGDLNITNDPSWTREGQIWISQSLPLPLTILAIVPTVTSSAQ